jgi:hypothetical protein
MKKRGREGERDMERERERDERDRKKNTIAATKVRLAATKIAKMLRMIESFVCIRICLIADKSGPPDVEQHDQVCGAR